MATVTEKLGFTSSREDDKGVLSSQCCQCCLQLTRPQRIHAEMVKKYGLQFFLLRV